MADDLDWELDSLVRQAAEPVRRTVLRLLVSRLAAGFDLTSEPPVEGVVDALKLGFPPDDLRARAMAPLLARLRREGSGARWHAAAAIGLAAAPDRPAIDAFRHASLALGEEWPEVRAYLLTVVRGEPF